MQTIWNIQLFSPTEIEDVKAYEFLLVAVGRAVAKAQTDECTRRTARFEIDMLG